jgi:cold shock CspA family protein
VTGTVQSFSARRGDGFVDGDDGESYYFHCVNIADGSREIAASTRVSARMSVGLLGRDELSEIYALADAATRTNAN